MQNCCFCYNVQIMYLICSQTLSCASVCWEVSALVGILCTYSLTQMQSFLSLTVFLANFIHSRIKDIKEP